MDTNPEPRRGASLAEWVALVMLLWPQGSRVRGMSLRTDCLSNLKQIGLSMAIYAEDNQGRFPMDAANPTQAGSLRMMSNTLTSVRILACPAAVIKRRLRPAEEWSSLTARNISYMYVPNLAINANPDAIVALDKTDCVHAGCNWPRTGNHGDTGGNILFFRWLRLIQREIAG